MDAFRRRRQGRLRLQPQHGAGFVQDVDRAVGQPRVAQVPRGELGGAVEGAVRVGHVVVLLVARPQALEDPDGLVDRRLVHGDLLQPAGQAAILLDLLELLERRRPDDAQLAGGQHRLDQRGEVHRAAGGGAGADGGVHFVDEQDRLGPLGQRGDDGLEPLLEVAAEARPGEQRGRVQRVDFGALEDGRHVILQQPLRQAFGQRGLADAGFADEHGVVLAPAAEHFHRPLQLVAAADQRVELAGGGARRQVHRVGDQRIAGRGLAFLALSGRRVAIARRRRGRTIRRDRRHLRDAVADEVQDVQARDALAFEQLRGERLVLLQHRREQVAGLDLGPAGALHVQHGGLQRAAEGQRLLGLLLPPVRELFDLV